MLTESKTEENSSFENRNFKTKAAEKIIPQEPKPRGEKKKKKHTAENPITLQSFLAQFYSPI